MNTSSYVRPGRWPDSLRGSSLAANFAHGEPVAGAIAILGMPDDLGVRLNGGRPGAAEGPTMFREGLARYGVAAARHWPRVVDVGDVVPGETLEETHRRVSVVVREIVAKGGFPVGIGGGHDLTFAFVRGVVEQLRRDEKIERLEGIYLDAHLDVRPSEGSGMPFRALTDAGLVGPLHAQGIDPCVNRADHFAWLREHGGKVDDLSSQGEWPKGPLFVSLDMDVIDQAYAAGVSATNPAGWSPRETAAWCHRAGRELDVRCFDIMEFAPPLDISGNTARLAAHLFTSFLSGYAER